jgi:dihydrofolate reductase
MGKIIASINVTADGFCEHTDAIVEDEHHRFAADLVKQADLLLFGRVTYQLFEGYWPSAARDISLPKPVFELAQLLDNVKKVVASRTLSKVSWNNSTLLPDVTIDTITAIKQVHNHILLFGSPGLLSVMSKQGLIDEYYFTIQPMLAGKGHRIFDMVTLEQRLNLKYLETKKFASGVVTLCYGKSN